MKTFPLLVLSVIVACGGDDDGTGTPIDGPPVAIDAPPVDAPIDAPDCKLSTADFGTLGALTGGMLRYDGGANPMPQIGLSTLFLPLEQDGAPDTLVFQLWSDYTPFGTSTEPGPLVAGTYPLTGPQLAFADCGVCVTIAGSWAEGTPIPLDAAYMVTGGTVVINTIDARPGGAFDFTMTDLTFEHVRIQGNVSTPLNDGCVTAITSLSYTGTFETDNAAQKGAGPATSASTATGSVLTFRVFDPR